MLPTAYSACVNSDEEPYHILHQPKYPAEFAAAYVATSKCCKLEAVNNYNQQPVIVLHTCSPFTGKSC